MYILSTSSASASDSEYSSSDTDQELSPLELKRLRNIERINEKKKEIFGEEYLGTKQV